jgi:hypothetical protein
VGYLCGAWQLYYARYFFASQKPSARAPATIPESAAPMLRRAESRAIGAFIFPALNHVCRDFVFPQPSGPISAFADLGETTQRRKRAGHTSRMRARRACRSCAGPFILVFVFCHRPAASLSRDSDGSLQDRSAALQNHLSFPHFCCAHTLPTSAFHPFYHYFSTHSSFVSSSSHPLSITIILAPHLAILSYIHVVVLVTKASCRQSHAHCPLCCHTDCCINQTLLLLTY